jgi:hypothetical protein
MVRMAALKFFKYPGTDNEKGQLANMHLTSPATFAESVRYFFCITLSLQNFPEKLVGIKMKKVKIAKKESNIKDGFSLMITTIFKYNPVVAVPTTPVVVGCWFSP